MTTSQELWTVSLCGLQNEQEHKMKPKLLPLTTITMQAAGQNRSAQKKTKSQRYQKLPVTIVACAKAQCENYRLTGSQA